MFPRRAADLESTFHRRFRSVVEHQRHPISGWDRDEPPICLGRAEMFRFADDPIKQLEQSPLLVRYELGITDDVDEEHIVNLQLDLLAHFSRHCETIIDAALYLPYL